MYSTNNKKGAHFATSRDSVDDPKALLADFEKIMKHRRRRKVSQSGEKSTKSGHKSEKC